MLQVILSQLQYCAVVTNPLSRNTKTDGNILLFSLMQAKYMSRWIGSNCEVKNQNIISAFVFESNNSLPFFSWEHHQIKILV